MIVHLVKTGDSHQRVAVGCFHRNASQVSRGMVESDISGGVRGRVLSWLDPFFL